MTKQDLTQLHLGVESAQSMLPNFFYFVTIYRETTSSSALICPSLPGCSPVNSVSKTYQAYALGASPPDPGKILSSSLRVSSDNMISGTCSFSFSCSTVRGPMIGAVTTGLCSSHANAILAGKCPKSAQSFSKHSILSR
jgi:hypothetical protein